MKGTITMKTSLNIRNKIPQRGVMHAALCIVADLTSRAVVTGNHYPSSELPTDVRELFTNTNRETEKADKFLLAVEKCKRLAFSIYTSFPDLILQVNVYDREGKQIAEGRFSICVYDETAAKVHIDIKAL
jgi:hypothetical protein